MKGLSVYVLRQPVESESVFGDVDCTNGGVTSRCSRFVLTGDGVNGPFEPSESAPELRLIRRNIGGREYLHAVPVGGKDPASVGWMFGGNFVTTSDSRFPNQYPIPVHDRQESQKLYDRLSR